MSKRADNVVSIPIAPASAVTGYETETVTIDEATPLVTVDESHVVVDDDVPPPVFRDIPFALLFLLHLAVMIVLGPTFAQEGYSRMNFDWASIREEIEKSGNDVDDEEVREFEEFVSQALDYLKVYPIRVLQYLVLPSTVIAFVFSFFAVAGVIRSCPKTLVYSCLITTIVWTALVLAAICISTQSIVFSIFAVFVIIVLLKYIKAAWQMVPFSAVNLMVAIEGISANWGIYLLAFVIADLNFVWSVYWLYVTVGILSYTGDQCRLNHPNQAVHQVEGEDVYDEECGLQNLAFFLLLLSLYWTGSVILNTIQVTVAGTLATWCFDKKEAASCCSPAVWGSFMRAITFSFGSICFGSLLQAFVSALRSAVENARANQRARDEGPSCGALLLCILECIASLLEEVIEYFNQWAYVFIGIYGYSYLESGKRVVELFRNRGWTTLVTDNLIGYVLAFTSFMVGIFTGVAAIFADLIASEQLQGPEAQYPSYLFGPLLGYRVWAFGIGFVVGIVICSVMMNVIRGAVNTLIVCWADAPEKMEENHPALTAAMAESWALVFPQARVHRRRSGSQPTGASPPFGATIV